MEIISCGTGLHITPIPVSLKKFFYMSSFYKKYSTLIQMPVQFVYMGSIFKKTLVQKMARTWHPTGDKPLSEPGMA